MPLFSVIIPLFNKENFIEDTLKSVLAQTCIDFEIIIVNDGSTDKSEEKVLAFTDNRIFYFFKENEGVSAARNFGIEKASGKYITFLDGDDFWYSDFLETMKWLISKFPDQHVFSSAIEVQIKNSIFKAAYSFNNDGKPQIINFFKASLNQAALCSSSGCFDAAVFQTVGNFNENLKTDEDIDMWIRIGITYPIVFNPKVTARYNYDANGLSKNLGILTSKTDFSNYSELEKINPDVRKYLSIHRFSMALRCKIANQKSSYTRFYSLIYFKDLSKKQRLLITLPGVVLQKLFNLKLFLQRYNVRLSAFK